MLGKDWGERLRLHHWEQGRLLTHAGVHPDLWPGTAEVFNKLCEEAMDALRHNRWNALLNCGEERGGDGVSGLLWSDFRWSFEAIPGLPQIVGHTPHPEPGCIRSAEGTENWDLDTECAWLGVLENGQFNIIKNTFTPGF